MTDAAEEIRVLHVDDDPEFADMAGAFLERDDDRFRVETAKSAADGLERLSEREFDCVVSDFDMPGRNGIEFLEAVRAEYPDLPFVLFTGKGNEEVASNAISAGVTDYLQKDGGTDQYAVLANRIRNAVDRREAERDRDRQLEAIETAQEGISILDENGRYIYVNQRFADLHGYDPEEMVGERWELAYRDEDVPEVREEILPEVRREGHWHGETVSLRAGGETVPVDHTLSVTDRGELVCTVRDISDRKAREQELREKTARLEALFEHSPDMINIHDAEGNLIEPNPRLCEKTGYDAAELTEMKVWELDRAIDPDRAQALWESMGVGDSRRLEGAYRCRDGSTLPVEVHLRRVRFRGRDRFIAIAHDITERRDRERKLELVETLFEHTQECQFIVDATDGEFALRHANGYYRRTVGLPPDEPAGGRTPTELFGEEAGQAVVDRYRECVETREPVDYTTELPVPEEGTVYRTILTPVVDDGEVTHVVGTARDITEQAERKRELEHYERLVESLPIGYARTSFDDEFLAMNGTFVELLGGESEADIRSRNVSEFYQDATTRDRLLATLREEGTVEGEELKVTTLDGETVWITVTGRVVEDDEPYIDALAQDITERKEYEQELRAERAFIDQCLDALEDVFYVFGPDGEILRWNERLAEVTGYSDEEIAEMEPTEFFPDDHAPRIAEAVEEVLETGRATVQADYLTKDGERIPHEFTGFRLTDPDGTPQGFAGIARDLRQRREYERQLEQRNEQLEEFASIVSHDLRNPLNVATGRLELARGEQDSRHLDAVADAHERIEELIEELLTLAREGTIALDREAVSLGELARAGWRTVATGAATLSVEGETTVRADESRLRQLLENLFRNAVEHGDGDVTVEVGPLDGGDGFYVADDGPGIPAADRERVFESGVTTGEEGIGAGLSIVRRVAEAHGWEVDVTDSDAGGARFEITGVEARDGPG